MKLFVLTAPRASSAELAATAMTSHSFKAGVGYVDHRAPPELPQVRRGIGHECNPPAGTATGSAHYLLPPGAVKPMVLFWVDRERAWAPPLGQGNRMAFRAEYLAAHGWRYARPAA